jgi:tetratricopeptide repeat protein
MRLGTTKSSYNSLVRRVRLAAARVVLGLGLMLAPRRAWAVEEDRAAAQQDFHEGQRAFAAGDYRRAASLFEQAYKRKPHPSASWNAARSWEHAGEHAEAANLYERFLHEAEPGARDRDAATTALKALASKLGRVAVTGAGAKAATVDGKPLVGDTRWVVPGEHVILGEANGESLRRTVVVQAGQSQSVALDPTPPRTEPTKSPPPAPAAAPADRGFHLPWLVVAAGGVLTATAGGLTIWSGLDTNAKRRAFDDAPTQENKDDGLERQTRTNILLGATIGLAALTGVAALFVDWRGPSGGRGLAVRPNVAARSGGLSVEGRFP